MAKRRYRRPLEGTPEDKTVQVQLGNVPRTFQGKVSKGSLVDRLSIMFDYMRAGKTQTGAWQILYNINKNRYIENYVKKCYAKKRKELNKQIKL